MVFLLLFFVMTQCCPSPCAHGNCPEGPSGKPYKFPEDCRQSDYCGVLLDIDNKTTFKDSLKRLYFLQSQWTDDLRGLSKQFLKDFILVKMNNGNRYNYIEKCWVYGTCEEIQATEFVASRISTYCPGNFIDENVIQIIIDETREFLNK